jgi:hypothetical protein
LDDPSSRGVYAPKGFALEERRREHGMVRRCLGLMVLVFISAVGPSYGQAPAYSSLQQAWQSAKGTCGTMVKHEGMYEFIAGEGVTCVSSVGTDLVIFLVRSSSTPKLYIIVPMDHIIIELQQ